MLPAYGESSVRWCQLALGPDLQAASRHTILPDLQRVDGGLLDRLFTAQTVHGSYSEVPRDPSH